MLKKIIAIGMSLCMSLCFALPAFAAEPTENTTYDPAVQQLYDNAEKKAKLDNGDLLYRAGNQYLHYDLSEDKVYIVATIEYPEISMFANHVPKDLTPVWIYDKTDGPYSTTVNMAEVNRILQDVGDWLNVIDALNIPIVLVGFLQIALSNAWSEATFWEIDDAYHDANDWANYYILCYFYSDSACNNLIGTDSFSYHG